MPESRNCVLFALVAASCAGNGLQQVDGSILTPAHVRILDEHGEEVNTYLRPVSEGFYMTSIWPSAETSNTIDLTDFRNPADGTEHVWRFAPGNYRATYHFRVGYPEWKGEEPFCGVMEIVPLLPWHFEDDTESGEGSSGTWDLKDAAAMALELAAGLDLGYGDQHDRIPDSEEIVNLLRRWWWRHRHRFGVTKSAGPEIVSARIAAIEKADEVLEASVDRVERLEDDGGRSIRLSTDYTIKGGALDNSGAIVREPPGGPKLPLGRGTRVVVCLVFDGAPEGKGDYRVAGPHGIWVIE